MAIQIPKPSSINLPDGSLSTGSNLASLLSGETPKKKKGAFDAWMASVGSVNTSGGFAPSLGPVGPGGVLGDPDVQSALNRATTNTTIGGVLGVDTEESGNVLERVFGTLKGATLSPIVATGGALYNDMVSPLLNFGNNIIQNVKADNGNVVQGAPNEQDFVDKAVASGSTADKAHEVYRQTYGAENNKAPGLLGDLYGGTRVDIDKNGSTGNDHIWDLPAALGKNLWHGMQGKDPIGYGDVPGLQLEEGDHGWTKAFKLGGALAADIAFDPINAISLGGSSSAKLIAEGSSKAVGAKGVKYVTKLFDGDDAKLLERGLKSTDDQLTQQAIARARGEIDKADTILADQASSLAAKAEAQTLKEENVRLFQDAQERMAKNPSRLLEEALKTGDEDLIKTAREGVTKQIANDIGYKVQESSARGGNRAVLATLRSEFGDDAARKFGEDLFSELPKEYRGGVGMRAPGYLGKELADGGIKVAKYASQGTLGGGRTLAKFGEINKAAGLVEKGILATADAGYRVRGAIKTNKLSQRVIANLGKDGETYAALVEAAIKNPGISTGLAARAHAAAREGLEAMTKEERADGMKLTRAEGNIRGMLNSVEGVSKKDAYARFTEFYHSRDMLTKPLPENASELDKAAQAAARMAVDVEDISYKKRKDLGLPGSELEDRRRILTKKARRKLNERRGDNDFKEAATNPHRARTGAHAVVNDEGIKEWMSAPEINALKRQDPKIDYDYYETDPLTIMRESVRRADKAVRSQRLANVLHDAGVAQYAPQVISRTRAPAPIIEEGLNTLERLKQRRMDFGAKHTLAKNAARAAKHQSAEVERTLSPKARTLLDSEYDKARKEHSTLADKQAELVKERGRIARAMKRLRQNPPTLDGVLEADVTKTVRNLRKQTADTLDAEGNRIKADLWKTPHGTVDHPAYPGSSAGANSDLARLVGERGLTFTKELFDKDSKVGMDQFVEQMRVAHAGDITDRMSDEEVVQWWLDMQESAFAMKRAARQLSRNSDTVHLTDEMLDVLGRAETYGDDLEEMALNIRGQSVDDAVDAIRSDPKLYQYFDESAPRVKTHGVRPAAPTEKAPAAPAATPDPVVDEFGSWEGLRDAPDNPGVSDRIYNEEPATAAPTAAPATPSLSPADAEDARGKLLYELTHSRGQRPTPSDHPGDAENHALINAREDARQADIHRRLDELDAASPPEGGAEYYRKRAAQWRKLYKDASERLDSKQLFPPTKGDPDYFMHQNAVRYNNDYELGAKEYDALAARLEAKTGKAPAAEITPERSSELATEFWKRRETRTKGFNQRTRIAAPDEPTITYERSLTNKERKLTADADKEGNHHPPFVRADCADCGWEWTHTFSTASKGSITAKSADNFEKLAEDAGELHVRWHKGEDVEEHYRGIPVRGPEELRDLSTPPVTATPAPSLKPSGLGPRLEDPTPNELFDLFDNAAPEDFMAGHNLAAGVADEVAAPAARTIKARRYIEPDEIDEDALNAKLAAHQQELEDVTLKLDNIKNEKMQKGRRMGHLQQAMTRGKTTYETKRAAAAAAEKAAQREVDFNEQELQTTLGDYDSLKKIVDSITKTKESAAQNEKVGDIVNAITDLTEKQQLRLYVHFGEMEDKSLKEARDELYRVRSLFDETKNAHPTDSAYAEFLKDNGFTKLGRLRKDQVRWDQEERIGTLNPKVQIPVAFSDTLATPAVAKFLESVLEVNQPGRLREAVDHFYQPFMGLWRTYATVIKPGFIARNISGAWWQAYIQGVRGKDWSRGVQYTKIILGDQRTLYKKMEKGQLTLDQIINGTMDDATIQRLKDITVGDGTLWDVHQAIVRTNTISGNVNASALDTPEGNGDAMAMALGEHRNMIPWVDRSSLKLPGKIGAGAIDFAANNKLVRWGGMGSEISEMFVRSSTMIAHMEKLGTDEVGGDLAGLYVRSSMFRYDDLSNTERYLMRQVFPFWTFARANFPYQARAIFHEPGKIYRMLTIMNAAKEAYGSSPELQASMPQYLRDQMGFVTGGEGDDDAATGWMLNTPLVDVNNWLKMPKDPTSLQSWGAAAADVGGEGQGMLNPLVKAGLETGSGTNSFTGQKFKTGGTEAPIWLKGMDKVLPGEQTWRDYETGETRGSDYFVTQAHGLLPGLGLGDRLAPIGLSDASDKMGQSWLNSTIGGLSPVTPSAHIGPRQIQGELRGRNEDNEINLKRAAAKWDMSLEDLRTLVDAGYTPAELQEMFDPDNS